MQATWNDAGGTDEGGDAPSVDLWCVQTTAIQQYTLDPEACLPDPSSIGGCAPPRPARWGEGSGACAAGAQLWELQPPCRPSIATVSVAGAAMPADAPCFFAAPPPRVCAAPNKELEEATAAAEQAEEPGGDDLVMQRSSTLMERASLVISPQPSASLPLPSPRLANGMGAGPFLAPRAAAATAPTPAAAPEPEAPAAAFTAPSSATSLETDLAVRVCVGGGCARVCGLGGRHSAAAVWVQRSAPTPLAPRCSVRSKTRLHPPRTSAPARRPRR